MRFRTGTVAFVSLALGLSAPAAAEPALEPTATPTPAGPPQAPAELEIAAPWRRLGAATARVVTSSFARPHPGSRRRVDGGLTNEPLMLELQADAIRVPVEAGGADATVAGAAALAAVGAGVLGSLLEAAELLPVDCRVAPRRDGAWRAVEHERWRGFVAAAAELGQ